MNNFDIENLIKQNEEFKLKAEKLKEYKRIYFMTNTKNKFKYCKCCDKNIKMGSFSNHTVSKKHLKKMENLENLENIEK
jgi:hypothetical protein